MLGIKTPDVPGHQQTEADSEKDERGYIYRRESAGPRSRENFFKAPKHERAISRPNCSRVSSKIWLAAQQA